MELAEDELEYVWEGLQELIENKIRFLDEQIEGDAGGIKKSLAVQHITYLGLCALVDSVRLAEKIDDYLSEVAQSLDAYGLIGEWKEEIMRINVEIECIQND